MVADDDEALARAREQAVRVLGPEATLDAVAVASNFERMVRIADSTGIPLDAPLEVMSQDLRADLDLARFGSSANTEASGSLRRFLGRVTGPAAIAALKGFGRFRRGRARRTRDRL